MHAALPDSALQQVVCRLLLHLLGHSSWVSNPEQGPPLYRRGSLMLSTLSNQLPLEDMDTLQTGAACEFTK